MKIYTITFSCTVNVGAELQEYALYKYLKNQGNDVKVINYKSDCMCKIQRIEKYQFYYKSLRELAAKILYWNKNKKQRKKFEEFEKNYIDMTSQCKNIHDIENLPVADFYITGSDQVWNTAFIGFDDGYFLNGNLKGVKMSYAASMGRNFNQEKNHDRFLSLIKNIDIISTREKDLHDELQKELPNKEITHVCDPVFLLSNEEYQKIMIKPKLDKYIFIYQTAINPLIFELAGKIAKEKNLKVVMMNANRIKYPNVDYAIGGLGPNEFIGWVNNADYIITNSFHCLAFSIILEKQFFTVPLEQLNSRLDSLLETSGLEYRSINRIDDCNLNNEIDYENSVNKKMNEYIEKSKSFIEYSLNKDMRNNNE